MSSYLEDQHPIYDAQGKEEAEVSQLNLEVDLHLFLLSSLRPHL